MEMRIVKMDKIGYMGIPGSFSEVAANELLAQAGMTETELVPLVCAKNILEAMQKGEVQYGVLGVENSTAGPVGEFVHTFENISYEKANTTLERFLKLDTLNKTRKLSK